MRLADLDCVTIDAYGTLVELVDPVAELERMLREHGVERTPGEIEAAFGEEVSYYRERTLEGRDSASLEDLRRRCCEVFLRALGADLGVDAFLTDFLGALRFRAVPGAAEAVRELRGRHGPRLAVVSNWDFLLPERLEEAGLSGLFDAVVSSASCGVEKPDPRIFRCALERVSAAPKRSLHVGDQEVDRIGALEAGMLFAPAPLATAFEGCE